MPSKFFDQIEKEVPKYLEIFASKSLDIIEQIHLSLAESGMTQKDLASSLGKSESEISKWLSGGHNITLKTIAKIEDALDDEIIVTPKKASERFELIRYEDRLKLKNILADKKLHIHSRTKGRIHKNRDDFSKFKPLF
ncbi:MAG: helix-turn-helix transcriptional regulator [Bacteroidota bacterium]